MYSYVGLLTMDTRDKIFDVARQVKDAKTYDFVTDVVFEDGVNFGRICVWHSFSCQLYTLFPAERTKEDEHYL